MRTGSPLWLKYSHLVTRYTLAHPGLFERLVDDHEAMHGNGNNVFHWVQGGVVQSDESDDEPSAEF